MDDFIEWLSIVAGVLFLGLIFSYMGPGVRFID